MNWTTVLFIVMVIGLVLMAAAAVGTGLLQDCQALGPVQADAVDAVDACYAAIDPQRQLYAAVSNAGFAVMVIGALGLLGRYTGLLRH